MILIEARELNFKDDDSSDLVVGCIRSFKRRISYGIRSSIVGSLYYRIGDNGFWFSDYVVSFWRDSSRLLIDFRQITREWLMK